MSNIPVGSIIPFIGNPDELSKDWHLCDGWKVDDRRSPLYGRQLPNLTDGRFLMGVGEGDAIAECKGSNQIPSHTVVIDHATGPSKSFAGYIELKAGDEGVAVPNDQHTHDLNSKTVTHDHGGDKRPQWCSVLFICRIR